MATETWGHRAADIPISLLSSNFISYLTNKLDSFSFKHFTWRKPYSRASWPWTTDSSRLPSGWVESSRDGRHVAARTLEDDYPQECVVNGRHRHVHTPIFLLEDADGITSTWRRMLRATSTDNLISSFIHNCCTFCRDSFIRCGFFVTRFFVFTFTNIFN